MSNETVFIDTHPEPTSRMLGKWMSAAMVVGTMIGSGIYLLPTTLAPYGYNLVIAFLVTGFGTMCLAYCLARLAAAIPGGTLVTVPKAGHLSNMENAEAFNGAVGPWLAGV